MKIISLVKLVTSLTTTTTTTTTTITTTTTATTTTSTIATTTTTTTVSVQANLPECSQGSIYLPHPSDCSKFFHCSNGEAQEKECQAGLYFNPNINVCDFPINVDCN